MFVITDGAVYVKLIKSFDPSMGYETVESVNDATSFLFLPTVAKMVRMLRERAELPAEFYPIQVQKS